MMTADWMIFGVDRKILFVVFVSYPLTKAAPKVGALGDAELTFS